MLSGEALETASQKGKLFPACRIADWEGQARVVWLCRPIKEAIEDGRVDPDPKVRDKWAEVEAAFSHFIEGRWVDENLLKQLKDYRFEHWEFRCRRPRPSIRVFGRFARPDVFIATHPQRRDRLGGMNSPEFEHEKLVCEECWDLAGLGTPFTAAPEFDYRGYVTSNATRKPRI